MQSCLSLMMNNEQVHNCIWRRQAWKFVFVIIYLLTINVLAIWAFGQPSRNWYDESLENPNRCILKPCIFFRLHKLQLMQKCLSTESFELIIQVWAKLARPWTSRLSPKSKTWDRSFSKVSSFPKVLFLNYHLEVLSNYASDCTC